MSTTTVPFGLTLLEPVPASVALLADHAREQQRHISAFRGRPLNEVTREDLLVMSNPTELDGKDPINVDTDPMYD